MGRVSGNILRMRNDPKHCGSFGSVITRTKIALPYATQHTGELHLDVPVAFNSEGGQVLGFLSGAELVIADGARRDLVGRNRVPRQHVVGCVTRSVSRCALVFSEKFNLALREVVRQADVLVLLMRSRYEQLLLLDANTPMK